MKKRALLSVSDKTGIVDFAKGLDALGFELVSTGGTAVALEEAGLVVTNVSEITGFPECLDGRVKTLHPAVHAGILAMRGNAEHKKQIEELGIVPIDVVAINLYPFKQTIAKPDVSLETAIENIDIGGPAMIRAAAKNHPDVLVVTDPDDYGVVLSALQEGKSDPALHFSLALKVFEHTAAYDALIVGYLRKQVGGTPEKLTLTFEKVQDLRYGENPHQSAAFYADPFGGRGTLAGATQLWGKELSFNNINDANGALQTLKEFGDEKPCVVAVKHANPCGVARAKTLKEAYILAHDADPTSIFGGIVAVNRPVDRDTAEEMAKIFLEIVLAPAFDENALAVLQAKKNIRLMTIDGIGEPQPADGADYKRVMGGLLVQQADADLLASDLRVVTKRAPSAKEIDDLLFAFRVVKQTKSNAIVLAKDSRTIGIGPGQTNRITSLDIAVRYAGDAAKGAVMASDAFFPFDDCVTLAAQAGITAIVQPGGSIRDQDSIDACDKAGIAMVFTGMRHFKH